MKGDSMVRTAYFTIFLFAAAFLLPLSYSSSFAVASASSNSSASGVSAISLNSSVSTFLSQYIPSSALSSSSFYLQRVGASTYIVMKSSSGYIVVNVTGGRYSVLLNSSQIYPVLRPFLLSIYFPNQSIFSNMSGEMKSFISQASPNINDCLIETGLSQYTCTLANQCFSCQTVPNCKKVLSATGGPSYPFGLGIMNFSSSYASFNSSYNTFESALSGVNESNINSRLASLKGSLSSIISLSASMPHNPIFPLPSNFSSSLFQNCPSYVSNQAPWYCTAVGYCKSLSFNNTILSAVSSQLSSLSSLPISNSSVSAESSSSAQLAASFVQPVLNKELQAQFSAFMNYTYPRYNSTVKEASFLASRLSNSSLAFELASLESQFSKARNLSINQNISAANSSISSLISRLNTLDSQLSSLYMPVYNASLQSTLLIAMHELDYQHVPYQLASIAAQMQQINAELSTQVNSTTLTKLSSTLDSIKAKAQSFAPAFSMPALVKSIDGGIISSLLSGSSASVSSKLAAAPLYAALISFLIGIVVLLLFYSATYGRLKKRRKLKITHRTKRAWKLLFLVLLLLVLVYTYATYAYAAGANSFLPLSSFTGAVKAHSIVFVAVNTSSALNTSTVACATALQSTLSSLGKVSRVISISNGTCILSNATETISGTACYNQLMASGTPVVLLGANTTIYKGMYGNIMYVGSSLSNGASCYISKILSYAETK
jgi:hypothetical protein